MQSLIKFYQVYLHIWRVDKSVLKSVRNICNFYPQRSRNEHVTSLTASTWKDLQKSVETDIQSSNASRIFERIAQADDLALLSLPKRTWGSVFYVLSRNREFDILDKIRVRTKDLNINCGEGALTSLIKSYVARNKAMDAANILNEMKISGLLTHNRAYFPVITCLAENGYQNEAFELFREMRYHTFKSHKGITLAMPPNMGIALIRCCIQSNTSKYGKAKELLQWYTYSGKCFTSEVLHAVKQWFDCDPVHNWTMKKCQVSEEGLCSSCGKLLSSGLLTWNESEKLKLDILNSIESVFIAHEKMRKKEKFQNFSKFLKQCPPCDVIIDGMSIGLSSDADKQKNRFNSKALLKVIHQFIGQRRRIFVVLNTSISPNFLPNNVKYFVSDVGDDDLYIMYASALWNMTSYLVTRDKFLEHRFHLALNNHAPFMKWLRSHIIKVGIKRGTMIFHTQKYDHVVQTDNLSWHLPLVDNSWFCVTKLENKL